MTLNRRNVIAAGAAAAVLGARPAAARTVAAYDAALDVAFAAQAPVALAGGVVTREGLVWSGVRGVRRFGGTDLATLDDRWHLGSNTKAMTAALFARLVEQGPQEWGVPLEAMFPDVTIDPAWDGAVVFDFLRHRSGLNDAEALGARFFMTARGDPRSLPQQRLAVVERALSRPPTGQRGEYVYANVNYMLVGAMIERTTGRAWEEVMQTDLFDPLGLKSAGFGAPGQKVEGGENVWGHTGVGGSRAAMSPADPLSDNPPALGPAGTAHMTLADYARWLQVFLKQGDGWISPETIAQLMDTGDAEGTPYGLGWIVLQGKTWSRGPILTHDGSNTLWYATAVVAPGLGVAFIGLTNEGDGAAATGLMPGLIRAFEPA